MYVYTHPRRKRRKENSGASAHYYYDVKTFAPDCELKRAKNKTKKLQKRERDFNIK